ncbi:MAG: hypothetical protein NTZ14_08260, partial [Hyphomicrobiales bacterium]|nr:hypothetical protein [Hyphomicrobiales bacterium]
HHLVLPNRWKTLESHQTSQRHKIPPPVNLNSLPWNRPLRRSLPTARYLNVHLLRLHSNVLKEIQGMPRDPLHRLLIVNLLSGAAIGVLFVIGLLSTDAYGLRTLISRDPDGLVALIALLSGCIITASSAVAGSAIMLNRKSRDDDDDRGGGPGIEDLVPIKVRSRR